ncbi:MAG: hypothetical protein LBP40_08740 [Campylobacteraceae bacterium]|jgi:hypothetical protein|nr:hypothetical protein [Campylobacteraceae bacterium]
MENTLAFLMIISKQKAIARTVITKKKTFAFLMITINVVSFMTVVFLSKYKKGSFYIKDTLF